MKSVTINARKYDGSIHRSWQCSLLGETPEYWLFAGTFDTEIRHSQLGVIRPGTISYEYYWKNAWFNVFQFHEPEGEFRYFYCNVNMPPTFEGGVLDYVDLDIDVLVQPDFSFAILDEDEFRQNSRRFGYPPEIENAAKNALDALLGLIETRCFPFDEHPGSIAGKLPNLENIL